METLSQGKKLLSFCQVVIKGRGTEWTLFGVKLLREDQRAYTEEGLASGQWACAAPLSWRPAVRSSQLWSETAHHKWFWRSVTPLHSARSQKIISEFLFLGEFILKDSFFFIKFSLLLSVMQTVLALFDQTSSLEAVREHTIALTSFALGRSQRLISNILVNWPFKHIHSLEFSELKSLSFSAGPTWHSLPCSKAPCSSCLPFVVMTLLETHPEFSDLLYKL